MEPARWQQVKQLLDASEGKDSSEISAWLREACANDDELREQVKHLLSYDDLLDSFSVGAVAAPVLLDDKLEEGHLIGPYRIVELLGRGGMGAVYRAERSTGFRQTVALKLLRTGLESRRALDRFHRERQILAKLQHPNIAHLLDGGTSDDGQPYFAMELVEGAPIDDYCNEHRLGVRQRVELMLPICDALQFAHRNLVIHRDLKPGNILVDQTGNPKLLDFGIAKLIGPEVAATEMAAQAMTPRYASPEQLLGSVIATASDVYSLGVVLYQLLTGRLPCGLDTCSLGKVPWAICHEEPKLPSEVVRHSTRQTPSDEDSEIQASVVAELRGLDVRGLQRQLRGDLDAIVLKALRKEPEMRYVSVEAFAEDLRRYLRGLPVKARRGTWRYRAGKYARRHRWGLASAATVLALIFSFTFLLARQLEHTEMQRDRAENERDRAEHVSTFLVDLFRAAEPDRASAEPSVLSLVETGRQRLHRELADAPEVRANLLNTLGQVFDRLGHYDSARQTLAESLATLRELHPGDHEDVAQALNDHAVLAYRRGDYEAAESFSRECIAMRQRLGLLDDLIKPTSNLAAVLRLRGRLDEASALYRQGLELRRARWGTDHPNVARSLSNLAIVHYLAGDFEDAESLLEESLAIRLRAYEPGSVRVAAVLTYLARIHHMRGELDEAEKLYRRTLAIRRERQGPDHLRVATVEKDYAALLIELDDLEAAGAVLGHALAVLHEHKPADDPILAEAESVYGAYLSRRGYRDEAEVCLRSALSTLEETRGPDILPSRMARQRLEAWIAAGKREAGS